MMKLGETKGNYVEDQKRMIHFDQINENLFQNNQRVNELIKNLNQFSQEAQKKNRKKFQILERIEGEVTAIDKRLNKDLGQEELSESPQEEDIMHDYEFQSQPKVSKQFPRPKNKKQIQMPKSSKDNMLNLILLQNLVESKKSEKKKRKNKQENMHEMEGVLRNQNCFLQFLMSQQGKNQDKNVFYEDLIKRLNNVEQIIQEERDFKQQRSKFPKVATMQNYLNRHLLQNYQVLNDMTQKVRNKLRDHGNFPSLNKKTN